MDLEETVKRQREALTILTNLIAELLLCLSDDLPDTIDLGTFTVSIKFDEEQRLELRDRAEETVDQFIKEGLIDIDPGTWEEPGNN